MFSSLPPPSVDLGRGVSRCCPTPVSGNPLAGRLLSWALGWPAERREHHPLEGRREPLRADAVLGLWCTLCRAGDGGFSLVLSAVVSWCSSSPGGRAFSRPLPRTPDSSCLLTAPAGKAHQNCLTVSWEVKPGGNSDILSWPGARKSVSVIRVRISARSRCALPRGRSFSTLLLLLDFTCECLCI